MTFPSPGILYRIRSTDFRACLELWDKQDNRVVLRNSTETNLQQWLFVKDSGQEERYRIMATATQSSPNPLYLRASTEGYDSEPFPPPRVVPAAFNPSLWRIYKEEDGSYGLATKSQDASYELLLRVTEAGRLDSVERRISTRQVTDRSMRWEILEYWPSVAKGTYRIRTFNGGALDINGGMTRLSIEAVRKDYRQEWIVEPKGNGKCIISLNVKDKVYLGWEKDKDGIPKVTATKVPVEWHVDQLSDLTYSISSDDVSGTKTILSLSVIGQEVTLEPKKVAYSQIWSFESVDVPPSGTTFPPFSLMDRYSEISEAEHRIRCLTHQMYFAFVPGDPWTVNCLPLDKITHFPKLTYVGKGNTFTLSNGGWYARFSGLYVEAVNGPSNATAWVLERADDPAGGYFYYIYPLFDRSQAVSGYASGPEGKKSLRVYEKRDAHQHWKFNI